MPQTENNVKNIENISKSQPVKGCNKKERVNRTKQQGIKFGAKTTSKINILQNPIGVGSIRFMKEG